MSITRNLTILTALCALTLTTPLRAEVAIPDKYKTGGFAIGCQAYSFNKFTVMEAIEKTAEAGGKIIEFYPGQKLSAEKPTVKFSHDAPEEVIAEVKAALAKHDIFAANYGVVGIPNDEAKARKIFEFAKKMGMYGITTESTDSIDVMEKLAKEFDICVCFHNHPKREKNPDYKVWDPNYILSIVKDRDRRIGACADLGHWSTSGLDPLECVKILKGHITSLHFKDREKRGPGSHDVPAGSGALNIKEVLAELKSQGFAGNVSIEYEYHWDNSVPEIKQGIDFVRSCGK